MNRIYQCLNSVNYFTREIHISYLISWHLTFSFVYIFSFSSSKLVGYEQVNVWLNLIKMMFIWRCWKGMIECLVLTISCCCWNCLMLLLLLLLPLSLPSPLQPPPSPLLPQLSPTITTTTTTITTTCYYFHDWQFHQLLLSSSSSLSSFSLSEIKWVTQEWEKNMFLKLLRTL